MPFTANCLILLRFFLEIIKCSNFKFFSFEENPIKFKNFFKECSVKKIAKSKYSKKEENLPQGKWLGIITKKPVVPTREEVQENPRSRSAKLRVAEKIGGNNVT